MRLLENKQGRVKETEWKGAKWERKRKGKEEMTDWMSQHKQIVWERKREIEREREREKIIVEKEREGRGQ